MLNQDRDANGGEGCTSLDIRDYVDKTLEFLLGNLEDVADDSQIWRTSTRRCVP